MDKRILRKVREGYCRSKTGMLVSGVGQQCRKPKRRIVLTVSSKPLLQPGLRNMQQNRTGTVDRDTDAAAEGFQEHRRSQIDLDSVRAVITCHRVSERFRSTAQHSTVLNLGQVAAPRASAVSTAESTLTFLHLR